ncbi:MAG: hypothetical protein AUJ92_05950 [Armatimonadetes bacterium CG2_30_59_28]|nr:hypothetical protein [Armatimonadota bacterium]OIO96474.1 MAG: hypothetical protein AUJ92_05950 [Armatimonadetes bacterium CG2_30_59_28]PIU67027.1 MAG: hypothetical protein COS85_02360 [Armatimonadetes bacterium CG07_land_8_20_14_0_80_59_28]PIX44049.1 MAG: hypothetical protein COZ56_05705 [Armatimonadetes bacterium CG_4_8_14_3_um_filter_58_9]PIY48311.1 MAG: hypothetical protein COZ05_03525 [Armatimonadetes bacterium CG_4_10_14_3_um_filter_59_10]PJB76906.1 MAG: hypothetical protein CO095_020
MTRQSELVKEALRLLAERCPRLAEQCYWAGTSAIALEELGHRDSIDLDFHTRRGLVDVRPILAEIQKAFPGSFEVIQSPDEFGSGFRGLLTLPSGGSITIEALSNFEETASQDLVPSSTVPGMARVSLRRYLADKIQCVVERSEARDLLDIEAVLQRHPELEPVARGLVLQQDALLLSERLFSWTDEEIEHSLRPYAGSSPGDARHTRDLLFRWLKSAKETRP